MTRQKAPLDTITRIMTEQSGDGLEGHASVDGLGGEGVAELVGVGGHAGAAGDATNDAPDLVAVDGAAVVGDEPVVSADAIEVVGAPPGEECDEVGVEGDEAVGAQFADGDAQPVAVSDAHDGVGVEVA
jgi:hypothetical protein